MWIASRIGIRWRRVDQICARGRRERRRISFRVMVGRRGAIKATENFFRAQGIGKDDAVAILLPSCPRRSRRSGGGGLWHRRAAQSSVHARAIVGPAQRGQGKLLLAPPGMPGGLYEKIEGLHKEVPSLRRIVIARSTAPSPSTAKSSSPIRLA